MEQLSLLILVCIHKSYIVYLEIYVVPMGFHLLVMEKSWKINVEKRGHPAGEERVRDVKGHDSAADTVVVVEETTTVQTEARATSVALAATRTRRLISMTTALVLPVLTLVICRGR